ncbi:MAG TPA: hypothetical protein VJR89_18155 [Polyangiales bacterium]|nr:hypothetical protein [Polyangiales bacterium]
MPLPVHQVQVQRAPQGDRNEQLQKVAKQFESVLVGQLLEVLWKTTPTLGGAGGGQAGMYQQMFQGAFADHLVSGGGIGLSSLIAKGLGVQSGAEAPLPLHVPAPLAAAGAGAGMLGDMQRAAADMLQGDAAARWAKDGKLESSDLPGLVAAPGGEARSSVAGANGYQGYYKCNLFAFEMARRAGMQVPESIQSSNRITQDASDGSLDAGWAKVATGTSPAAMQDALRAGEAAFLLVGGGQGERHGHMAVIERPKSIDYDAEGQVQRIVFDGWEAQPDGAKHLKERAWNRMGNAGGPGDRNGLTRIEIIQLSRPEGAGGMVSDPAKTDKLNSVSSNEPRRPTQGGKEHS